MYWSLEMVATEKQKIGCIHVDYDKLPGGSEEVQSGMVVKEKVQLPQEKQEQDLSFEFTRKRAFHFLDLIRHDQALTESLGTLTHWFERGECKFRSTVNVFHALLNTVNSLIKRLVSRRKEHGQRVEEQKQPRLWKEAMKSNSNVS